MNTYVPLKRRARVQYGLGQPPPLSEDGVPIIRATNIFRGSIVANDLIRARADDLPLDRAPLLKLGEVLVVRSGAYTGDSALITPEWVGAAPGYDLRITPGLGLEPRFIAYTMLGRRAMDQIDLAKSRAAQPHLNAEDLGEVDVLNASISRQRAIADYLDLQATRLDALITAKRRMVELLEERLLAVARVQLTGGSAACERWSPGPEWLAPVPTSWPPRKIAWYKRTGSGTTPASDRADYYADEGGIPWVTTAELRETEITATSRQVTTEALHDCSALRMLPPETLLVAMYGATIGRLGILKIHATVNQACCAIWGGSELDQAFLFWWLRAFRTELLDMARGAGQPNIGQDTIRSLRVPAPSVSAQRELADARQREMSSVTDMSRTLSTQIDLLQERRQALITAAVTGQLDIPEAA